MVSELGIAGYMVERRLKNLWAFVSKVSSSLAILPREDGNARASLRKDDQRGAVKYLHNLL